MGRHFIADTNGDKINGALGPGTAKQRFAAACLAAVS
jgi:hypothetical protein